MDHYLDASNQVAGRLASNVAKILLNGDNVFIINAEKAVISGRKEVTFREYKQKTDRGDPVHGPFYPRVADMMLKRIVRGMLPKTPKGRSALKRLKVYISTPEELKGEKFGKIKNSSNTLKCQFTPLASVTKHLTGKEYD